MPTNVTNQELFVQEAIELIDHLERAVLRLEKSRDDQAQLEEVFRVMHSFKGTAKMFGFDRIGEFTHYLENIFDALRRGVVRMSDEIFDVTFNSVCHIRHLIYAAEGYDVARHHEYMNVVKRLTDQTVVAHGSGNFYDDTLDGRLYLICFKPSVDFFRAGHNPLSFIYELSSMGNLLVRTHTDRLPSVEEYAFDGTYLYWTILLFTPAGGQSIRNEFIEVEELCDVEVTEVADENWLTRPGFSDFVNNLEGEITPQVLRDFAATPTPEDNDEPVGSRGGDVSPTVSVDSARADRILRIVSELTTTQARLSGIASMSADSSLRHVSATAEHLVRKLHVETFGMSLFPVSHLFRRFETLVRDTARELNKSVRLTMHGTDIEMDENLLRRLVDPMMHMLRNSIDHGIESPEIRREKGKNETGTIQLAARYSGTTIVIDVRDDGAGIDTARLREKAIENGIVAVDQKLTEKEAMDLIFSSGITTARTVTGVSGRGVGMDIVRHAIDKLQGEIEVQSWKDIGSLFRIRLPLTSGIMSGLLVSVSSDTFVIPLTVVQRCVQIERFLLQPDMENNIVLGDEPMPFVSLRRLFNCTDAPPTIVTVVVVEHQYRKLAIEVDRIVDERQVVIKPVGKMTWVADFAGGAAILDDGMIAFIIDTDRLAEGVRSGDKLFNKP